MIESVTSAKLRRLQEQSQTMLVLFGGDWCPDCRRFAPIWHDFTDESIGLKALHVEVSRDGREWEEWGLEEVPTVIFFEKGAEKGRVSGDISAGDMDSMIHG